MVPRMSEHGVEALLGLAFFGVIILFLWTSLCSRHDRPGARCPFLSPIASANQRQTGNYRFGSSFYSINIAEAAAKESAGGSQTSSNASEVSPCRSQLLELFRKPNLAPRCRVVAREKRLEVRQNCLLKRFAAFVCAHRRLIRP